MCDVISLRFSAVMIIMLIQKKKPKNSYEICQNQKYNSIFLFFSKFPFCVDSKLLKRPIVSKKCIYHLNEQPNISENPTKKKHFKRTNDTASHFVTIPLSQFFVKLLFSKHQKNNDADVDDDKEMKYKEKKLN